jgi:putative FmdB family regulatory protein
MPTYEYKCKKCGNVFEVFHSMSAQPVKTCPKCGGEVKKLIGSGAGTIFKGTGFYHTDYKNKVSKGKKTETQKTSPPKPEPKSDTPSKSE